VDAGPDVPALTAVLGLLAGRGWRSPRGVETGLCGLWEYLAGRASDAAERRRLLIAALEAAAGFDEVGRVRDQLAAPEGSATPLPGSQGGTGTDRP